MSIPTMQPCPATDLPKVPVNSFSKARAAGPDRLRPLGKGNACNQTIQHWAQDAALAIAVVGTRGPGPWFKAPGDPDSGAPGGPGLRGLRGGIPHGEHRCPGRANYVSANYVSQSLAPVFPAFHLKRQACIACNLPFALQKYALIPGCCFHAAISSEELRSVIVHRTQHAASTEDRMPGCRVVRLAVIDGAGAKRSP